MFLRALMHVNGFVSPAKIRVMRDKSVLLFNCAMRYGEYLPRRFLETPRLGTVNLHPSLLPRWRGASPVQRCLVAGDTETGITVGSSFR